MYLIKLSSDFQQVIRQFTASAYYKKPLRAVAALSSSYQPAPRCTQYKQWTFSSEGRRAFGLDRCTGLLLLLHTTRKAPQTVQSWVICRIGLICSHVERPYSKMQERSDTRVHGWVLGNLHLAGELRSYIFLSIYLQLYYIFVSLQCFIWTQYFLFRFWLNLCNFLNLFRNI